ncbi:hypothetical protein SK854_04430 [Lentzea sp. BCCO 10_0061]|uniref:Uncharacterized protein n=1 Tax=Lentzea sokolovensis TaxID=3095429 RepID=A0ABU4UQB3_9PSEU|nr:hypothetical protein [Lentzea sp. BCCO 10_0061]MDX8141347.1 hypothetical protein [Lentzea sp. BCCO 10_0061]
MSAGLVRIAAMMSSAAVVVMAISLVFLVNLLIMWNTETVPAVEAALPEADDRAFGSD